MRKLTLADITDQRAYERERVEFRAHIIDLKRRRRIPLGDIVTLLFENTDTMRFQVQEMARAERMLTDAAIAHEVDTYNELIPDAGQLSATLFIEIDDDAQLREWLPKLVGIEFSVHVELANGSRVDAAPVDEERLTRDDITSTVHYLRFAFTPDERAAFAGGDVRIVADHPAYTAMTELTSEQRAELAGDLAEWSVRIEITRLDPNLPLPRQAEEHDAGYDLYAREGVVLPPGGGRELVPTGIAIAIPPGFAGFVLPRSGIAFRHGVTCLNTPGLIDPLYRGEVQVLLVNTDPKDPYMVRQGDRIAQLVIERVETIEWVEVAELEATSRDASGFGSTGGFGAGAPAGRPVS